MERTYKRNNKNVQIDTEELEIIKLMAVSSGADWSLIKAKGLIDELQGQGYERERAKDLVMVARAELRETK